MLINPTEPVSSIDAVKCLSLAEVTFRLSSYMLLHKYSPEDYEVIDIGTGSYTLENSHIIWYYAFHLREYANPNHELNINIPCYKVDSNIGTEMLGKIINE